MSKRFENRALLVNYLIGRGFSTVIVSRVARKQMRNMRDEEKEKLSLEIYKKIQPCETEQEAISLLEQQEII